ncbi:MAG: hypothetical protein CSA26_03525 [Desulfobacterales bacterium]|nr:MAG: hypothetical protein CSA26_03525 [Desulfobacterales bacterium]
MKSKGFFFFVANKSDTRGKTGTFLERHDLHLFCLQVSRGNRGDNCSPTCLTGVNSGGRTGFLILCPRLESSRSVLRGASYIAFHLQEKRIKDIMTLGESVSFFVCFFTRQPFCSRIN